MQKKDEMPQPPAWAAGLEDMRGLLRWDSTQTVVSFAVNGKLALGVVDTGACKTIIDETTARALGLKLKPSVDGNCGTFSVPGSGARQQYAGVVEDPVVLQFGEHIRFCLKDLRVLKHPYPLVLIGADILRGGRPDGCWNYTGMH